MTGSTQPLDIPVKLLVDDPVGPENSGMRTHGKLIKWNEERGFGFIEPAIGGSEVFVHISAFPRDGVRPQIGELISFEIDQRSDGKQRAVRVVRPGSSAPSRRRSHAQPSSTGWTPLAILVRLLIVAALGWYGYTKLTASNGVAPLTQLLPTRQDDNSTKQTFTCDGRKHCSQMTSCAEATYFIEHCPDTQMDGDRDGRPCESQWCTDTW